MTEKPNKHVYEWLKINAGKISQNIKGENPLEKKIKELQGLLIERLEYDQQKKANLTDEEEVLLNKIKIKTREANRNNVTRTKAYGDFYLEHPEVHWAYLVHMVSRNGGWNMTDLKGDMLPHLLSEKERQDFFNFLERCNWLIFGDAYPQLLLYAESKSEKRRLFHLLPNLQVSLFMEVVWNWFWDHSNSKELAFALIINEQHYIESRVVQETEYHKNVLNKLEFRVQAFLHFNQVIFPYWDEDSKKMRIAGTVVENFKNLQERIKVGKRLYAILFEVEKIRKGMNDWSTKTIHTGSRSDYWPHIFSKQQKPLSQQSYKLHLSGNKLHTEALPLASPELEEAWSDVENPKPPEAGDWFHDLSIVKDLGKLESPTPYELTDEHYFALNKVELAVVASERLLGK